MKIVVLVLIFFSIGSSVACAGHQQKEKVYRDYWCSRESGQTEYMLDDSTRVDCLIEQYAVEFDFAEKWAEAIGQALYYGLKTNRVPAVVLIIEDEKDIRFLKRISLVAECYDITVWTISQDDLQ